MTRIFHSGRQLIAGCASYIFNFRNLNVFTGVIEIHYELSQSASLGNWTIQVTDDARMLYTKSFIVEEYGNKVYLFGKNYKTTYSYSNWKELYMTFNS